jgi:phosphate transport system protein
MSTDEYRDQLARPRPRSEGRAMAERVCDRHKSAVTALASGDPSAAERVLGGDHERDDWYLDIEADCSDLLALYQPVAGDLRLVAAAFKIVTDLERSGDPATNLAPYGYQAKGQLSEVADVPAVAETVGDLVADAAAAFTKRDAERARAVAARDEALDQVCRRQSETVVRALVTDRLSAGADADVARYTNANASVAHRQLERVVRALFAVRDIERVGDRASSICARTAYMIENDTGLIY